MKRVLKHAVNGAALLLILPCWLGYWLSGLLLGRQKVFPGWSQALSLVPGLAGAYLRRAFYRLAVPRCDADSFLGFGVIMSHPTIEIGRTVYVGPYCTLGDV